MLPGHPAQGCSSGLSWVNETQTVSSRRTFHPDVAVSLEMVVSGFPRVAVMTEQRDGRPGTHRDVSDTFFI